MAGFKGRLRIAVEDFLETNPISDRLAKWWKGVIERQQEVQKELIRLANTRNPLVWVGTWQVVFAGGLYALTGSTALWSAVTLKTAEDPIAEGIDRWSKFWRETMTSVERRQEFEALGAFFSEPLLAYIEGLLRTQDESPEDYLRRIYGILTALALAPSVAGIAAEVAGLGQVETVQQSVQLVANALSLDAYSQHAVSLFANSGFVPQMRAALHERYRPTRFSVSELRDLYALGEIEPERLKQEARLLGWREQDIDQWIALAFRTISEGDVWKLYNEGAIDLNQTMRRLRALGYDPDDIPLLFRTNTLQQADEAKVVTLATAKQAFREQLISESEFRQLLTDLKRPEREIELQVALAKRQIEQDLKALSVSQIRQAWEENVLSDAEAAHWLTVNDFQAGEIDVLLRTWRAQIDPPFRRLNKGTIVGAYTEAILNRSQALSKLEEVGLRPEDAVLELDLAEARSPEKFGRPPPKAGRQVSAGQLSTLLAAGLVTEGRMREKLGEIGYAQEDAALLTAAAAERARTEPRPLTQSTLEEAYVLGVLTRAQALERLIGLDFSAVDAEIIVQTVEQANPAVFAPEALQAVRLPAIGALVEATRTGILTELDFYARAAEIGYAKPDAALYLTLGLQQERHSAKTLTQAQIAELYERAIFDRGTALLRLVQLGYSDVDADLILRLKKSGVQDTDVWQAIFTGALTPDAGYAQLLSMGFTPAEIDTALAKLS